MRTPVVRMENDQSGHGRSTASGGGQTSVSRLFPPATLPVQTPKNPTMTHKECSNTLPMRETEPMDTYLPDGRETPERDDAHTDETNLPERDDTHTDETNLPGREQRQNIPVKEDRQNSKEREVKLVDDESQTNERHHVVYLPQPGEDEQNDYAEQVQVERPSSPPMMTWPAVDAHREVMRSVRERRPRPMFTYESLGQPSIQTHVDSTHRLPQPPYLSCHT